MKKNIFTVLLAVFLIGAACLAAVKYYSVHALREITAIAIPPFSEEITIYEGETKEDCFFEVISDNGFSEKDITFFSENLAVAIPEFTFTQNGRYVCYRINAVGEGETYIHLTVGDISSEKTKVTVLKKEEIPEKKPDVKQTEPSSHQDNSSSRQEEPRGDETDKKSSVVFVAPTGKRYHLIKTCAGKNAVKMKKSQALKSGKTPCKKCAGG